MAEGKKSFVLYCDLIEVVEDLSLEQRGQLLTTILEYVNDLKPDIESLPDKLVKVSFKHIRQDLKRDLEKWRNIVDRNRKNGSAGGRPKKNQENPVGILVNPNKPKKPDNDTDNDNVINTEVFSFKDIESEFFKEKPMKRPYFIRMVELHSLPINEIQKLFSEWKIKNEGKQMTISHAENSFNLYIKGNKKILEALTDPNLPSVKYPKSTLKDNDF